MLTSGRPGPHAGGPAPPEAPPILRPRPGPPEAPPRPPEAPPRPPEAPPRPPEAPPRPPEAPPRPSAHLLLVVGVPLLQEGAPPRRADRGPAAPEALAGDPGARVRRHRREALEEGRGAGGRAPRVEAVQVRDGAEGGGRAAGLDRPRRAEAEPLLAGEALEGGAEPPAQRGAGAGTAAGAIAVVDVVGDGGVHLDRRGARVGRQVTDTSPSRLPDELRVIGGPAADTEEQEEEEEQEEQEEQEEEEEEEGVWPSPTAGWFRSSGITGSSPSAFRSVQSPSAAHRLLRQEDYTDPGAATSQRVTPRGPAPCPGLQRGPHCLRHFFFFFFHYS
ncbi:hypothetical protein EYF80_064016 [Liparis tanakae]|uniref:Uncharacterized protein n=1 Tax=Liparis tanakae TaxID=230148 RepID=A0A4Z2EBD4_9TELE|nr:hypothetical protein EYF80_064016 [Liparis tanakae]